MGQRGREESDIDLIVVLRDLRERLEILGIAAAGMLTPIQASRFTPEERATNSGNESGEFRGGEFREFRGHNTNFGVTFNVSLSFFDNPGGATPPAS